MRDVLIAGGWVLAAILLAALLMIGLAYLQPPPLPQEQPEGAPEPARAPAAAFHAAPTAPAAAPAWEPMTPAPTASAAPWDAGVDADTDWRHGQGRALAAAVGAMPVTAPTHDLWERRTDVPVPAASADLPEPAGRAAQGESPPAGTGTEDRPWQYKTGEWLAEVTAALRARSEGSTE